MEKQILRGITVLILIAGIAMMALLVSAHAQAASSVVADIPFDFGVGGRSLSAGEYSVKALMDDGGALIVRNRDSNEAAIRLTNSVNAGTVPTTTKLVFRRYGQRYFLSQVWTAGERTGRQLLKSREERDIETQLAAIPSRNELALSSYETIEIVAMVR